MPNMSYVRFENTVDDMNDCVDHIYDPVSESEHIYRRRFIELCKQVASEFEYEDGSGLAVEDDEEGE